MNPLMVNKSQKDKKELEGAIKASLLSEVLREYLGKKLESTVSSERGISQFDNPNWESRQAYNNGVVTTLHDLLNILRK